MILPGPKEGAATLTGGARHRYSALVIAEVGICLVVLMAAGLMLRQLDRFSAYDVGYDARGMLEGGVMLFPSHLPPTRMDREFENIRERFLQVPGVQGVAITSWWRAAEHAITSDFQDSVPRFLIGGGYLGVTPDYLRVTGRRVIAGRGFEPGDRFIPVAVVDEFMADRMWPGMSPVGRMIKLGGPQSTAPWVRVVGVVRSNRFHQVTYSQPAGELLVSVANDDATRRWVTVRADTNSAVVATALRKVLADMFPAGAWGGGYFWDRERSHRESLRPFAFITNLFTGLGGLALLLAAVGTYGVLAYSVGQRMREFGIRLALGAETAGVRRLVLHDAAVMILAGTAIGAFFAMWAGTLMVNEDTSVIPPSDWVTLVSSEAVLLLVCFAACLTPAIRAGRANPLDVIRAI